MKDKMRRLSATPCPVSDSGFDRSRRDSIFSINNDTTANLDYTTEFKASFRDVKPRRPPAAARKRIGNNPAWTIHEDEELRLEPTAKPTSASVDSHQPGYSQESRRPGRRVSFVQTDGANEEDQSRKARPAATLSRAPRRLSIQPPTQTQVAYGDDTLPTIPAPKMVKPRRRGTVYIPSDDTTMPTMFMDIFSPLRKAPLPRSEAQDENCQDMTGLAMQMKRKKGPRKSMLAASPKRGPLLPALNAQPSAFVNDRTGQGPGKENIPPGSNENVVLDTAKPSCDKKPKIEQHGDRPHGRRALQSRLFESTASSSARVHHKPVSKDTTVKPAWNSYFLLPKPRKSLQPAAPHTEGEPILANAPPSLCGPAVSRRTLVPSLEPKSLPECDYLPEGVVDVSMYEQGWLGQQEIALTQLINQLFSAASSASTSAYHDELERIQIAEIYGKPAMAGMFRRVQESLSHGVLGVSQEVVSQGLQLYADLGRRKNYTNFWLANYNSKLLKSCLEVVVGRVVPSRTSTSRDSSDAKDLNKEQQSIRRFIERYLIRNEDATECRSTGVPSAHMYRRTMLRSLMLIKLLDLVKSEDCLKSKVMLFQPNSELKSSAAAVISLMRLLNPSGGDPARALRSIGYEVSHVQYALEEFDYNIHNLAVDLRDGVRLARLVELLLYRSASQGLDHGRELDATTTITMFDGHTVTLGDGHQDWPLSQHLKLPCISRATKLYNVQLALSALKEVKGMAGVIRDVEPADIVDGFREKTVRLLWGLSSKWGLGGLVDWEDVKSEIKRLGRSTGRVGYLYLEEFDCEEDEEGYLQYKSLLKVWVKAVAASRGLRVRNFTSDFADGRLFGVLVSEYQPLLTSFGHEETSRNLTERLRALGCSEEFGRLFAPVESGSGRQQIFDRDFVLASIAFLCSRLLGPTKRARAAVALQRAWRKHWGVVIARRRKVLRGVASDCANEVRMRKAKACIWRAWCQFRARREHSRLSSTEIRAPEEDIWLSL